MTDAGREELRRLWAMATSRNSRSRVIAAQMFAAKAFEALQPREQGEPPQSHQDQE